MQTTFSLTGSKRTTGGKGPARRVRMEGKLPAIVYGPGHEAIPVSVDPKSVRQVLNGPLGRNTVFTLDIDGQKQLAMVKSFDIHPLSRELDHVDFYTVKAEQAVRVEVPFLTTGKPKGVAAGGILRQVFRKLPIKALPGKIPEKIEIDVSPLELGHTFAAKDLILAEGVTVMLDPSQTIVSVVAPEKEVAAAAPVPGAPVAAAPAAGGKDVKAAAPAGKDAKGGAAPAKDAKAAAPAKDAKKK